MRSRTYYLVFAFSTIAWSQNTSHVTAPTLGYLFDSDSQSVRPMVGIPGASLIADRLESGAGFENAAGQLAVLAGSREVRVLQIREGAVSLLAIDGVSAAPDRIVLSPSGTAAAL